MKPSDNSVKRIGTQVTTKACRPLVFIEGASFSHDKASNLKDVVQATVTLPMWRDGTNNEKEQLRKNVLYLFQCLRERNITLVVIPLMIESALQWPEKQLLKAILFLRRAFVDTTVFCHPQKETYRKLMPIFQTLKGKFE